MAAMGSEQGLNALQTNQVRELIKEGMATLDAQSQAQLDTVRTQLSQAGEAFAQQNAQYKQQMDEKQEEISLYVTQLEKNRIEVGTQLDEQFARQGCRSIPCSRRSRV